MTPGQGTAASTAADRAPVPETAWVYLLRCPDGSLYCGWTNDLARRLKAHQSGKGGAKYTKSHGTAAVRLTYAERCADKSAALRRDAVTLRMATPDDAADVADLYNWYVTHGVQTFQYAPSTAEEYRQNIAEVLTAAPFLVARTADGRLLGFACAHPWHSREAYAWDVETTVYCAPDAVGQGIGKRLYTALLSLLRQQGYRNAYALVTGGNKPSDALHKALGFTRFGVEKRTGYKFGQWLDLTYWGLQLVPGSGEPAPVRKRLTDEEIRAVLENA